MHDLSNAVEVHGLRLKFGQYEVLKGIDHDFERGRIHGLVGGNGSGKTVMLKCICGFLRPTAGYVLVEGKRIGRDADFPEDAGIIIETPGFLPRASGLKNLEILASLKRKAGPREAAEAMRRVGLDPFSPKPVAGYSLGMRQRLGIAQAIMERPKLLILDEPLNGLDKAGAEEMRRLLAGLRGEGCTILLASHSARDIEELCDTVCEMDAGFLNAVPII